MLAVYINSDNRVRWDRMKDARDDSYVNTATVTFTLKNEDGTAIVGASAVSMPYVALSDGRYQGTLPRAASTLLTPGQKLFLELTATRGSAVAFRRLQCTAAYKGVA